ncbi:MAG: ATP-dependent 6-phosphofructokinase [Clostridia bacterium]|nr:ATP-dependent 6-phosphofructokinase [Clostridia bacterium]
MKRIGVLTSGGDAPGMNAAIRAVVRSGIESGVSVIGFKRGYNGIIMQSDDQRDDFELLTGRSVSGKVHRGGTFLMTARCLEFLDESVQKKAIDNLNKLGVEGIVCIGGNGTFSGADALYKLGYPTIGVPGTIDNDLEYTDYTIGFDTAVNTACECVNRIRESSESHERASMVTVMGRDCGEIAISTALASGAEIVLVPEKEWYIEDIADRVKWGVMRGKASMIMIFAEGAVKSLKSDLSKLCQKYDALSEVSLHRVTSSQIASIIEVLTGHETRATVLGYTQRGGAPSASDRILATRLGVRAMQLLRDDTGGRAVGIKNNAIIDVPLSEGKLSRVSANLELINMISEVS